MSLGIPGNFAAVFIILAVDTIGDFALGPHVFRFTPIKEVEGFGTIINEDLVIAFGLFTMMVLANAFNWTVGSALMGLLGYLVRIPKDVMLPVILTVSLTAAYVQDGGYLGLLTACAFAVIGYALRRLDVSILPFVIGFLLAPTLETLVRGAYTSSGGDALFLLKSSIALAMLVLSALLWIRMVRASRRSRHLTP